MNVFISYSHADSEFSMELASILDADGYDVFIDNKIPIGNNIYRDIGRGIAKADAIVVVVSQGYYKNGFVSNETISMLSFFDKGRMPLVIPVVLGENTAIPSELGRYNYLVIPYEKDKSDKTSNRKDNRLNNLLLNQKAKKKAIQSIQLILAAHNGKLENEKNEKKANEERVKTELSTYLAETMSRLRKNEKNNKSIACILYFLSIIPLVIAIILSIKISFIEKNYIDLPILLLIHTVTALLVVILLISTSKLLFTLAKSFMVESIRSSDRIHAISFGKFILDAYGNDVPRDEVIKLFCTWNIDDGKTSFRNQSSDEYDPKLVDVLKKISESKNINV